MAILGAILAGGAGRRIGGRKEAQLLGAKPLLRHAIDALAPQVDALCLCGPRHALGDFGYSVVPDPADVSGPAAGLVSAVRHARATGSDGLLIVPCDMPFLPANIAEVLSAVSAGPAVYVPAINARPIWTVGLLCGIPGLTGDLEALILAQDKAENLKPNVRSKDKSGLSLRQCMEALNARIVPLAERHVPYFVNINTPEQLSDAQRMLDTGALTGDKAR